MLFRSHDLLMMIIETTGYVAELEAEDTEEAHARIENIDELISKVVAYEESAAEPSLSGFLEEVALVADVDNLDENDNRVVLMTLHSAKGLEFPNVYLTGLEEGVFPSYMSIGGDDPDQLEEERRLCYVGITRAMQTLTITCAKQRMVRGETRFNAMSRFLKEIPEYLLDAGEAKIGGRNYLAGAGDRAGENISFGRSLSGGPADDVFDLPFHAPQKSVNNPYMQAKKAFQSKAFNPSQFKVKKSDHLDYGIGDTVKHIKFGIGTVQSIIDGGKDFEVTVDFEKYGVKKMFAAFAKLQKV